MGQEISFLSLIINATMVVQIIIFVLLIFSIVSWATIFRKWYELSRAKNANINFLLEYKHSNSIATLYSSMSQYKNKISIPALFYNGINEYNKLNKQGITHKSVIIENLERTIASSIEDQIDIHESNLSLLATFGSASPYIGLLGTVWGIMHSFIGLGNTGQATLASVAPGIAEALIATAIGLFVAIPAYIFHNKFSADITHLSNNMYKFGDDFLNLINRRLSSTNSSKEYITDENN